MDGLYPSAVPGVILLACGDLSFNQMVEIIIRVSEKTTIIATDFAEYVPEHDQTGIGAGAIAHIICNAITASTPISEK